MLLKRFTCCVAVVLFLVASSAWAEDPYANEWIQQSGTDTKDFGYGVTTDAAGNSYLAGYTSGDMGGTNQGGIDAFVTKYDASGSVVWTSQLGMSGNDQFKSVAVDTSGNVFVGGQTKSSLYGTNAGNYDAFLAKYDASGTWQWTRQAGSIYADKSFGVAVDAAGNAFLAGTAGEAMFGPGTSLGANDAFLIKYDTSGTQLWAKQFGTGGYDSGNDVAVDAAGNVFFTGSAGGEMAGPGSFLGGGDVFLAKFNNATGDMVWVEQMGSTNGDTPSGLALDAAGNMFISGYTGSSWGAPNVYGDDAFLVKCDTSGSLLWVKQMGTTTGFGVADRAQGVAVDAAGNAFITGYTGGDLFGPYQGNNDAFMAKYDTDGNEIWAEQFGSSGEDMGADVAMDAAGNMFIGGRTSGLMGGASYGLDDAFLAKYSVPEPGCFAMLSMFGLFGLLCYAWRKRR